MIRLAICRGQFMKRFVEGADRGQSTLLPECLDEWVEESNSARVVDCFVDGLDLTDLGFEGVEPAAKMRMGATHFLMKTLPKVASELALSVLAYNLTRVMNIVGTTALLAAIRA